MTTKKKKDSIQIRDIHFKKMFKHLDSGKFSVEECIRGIRQLWIFEHSGILKYDFDAQDNDLLTDWVDDLLEQATYQRNSYIETCVNNSLSGYLKANQDVSEADQEAYKEMQREVYESSDLYTEVPRKTKQEFERWKQERGVQTDANAYQCIQTHTNKNRKEQIGDEHESESTRCDKNLNADIETHIKTTDGNYDVFGKYANVRLNHSVDINSLLRNFEKEPYKVWNAIDVVSEKLKNGTIKNPNVRQYGEVKKILGMS